MCSTIRYIELLKVLTQSHGPLLKSNQTKLTNDFPQKIDLQRAIPRRLHLLREQDRGAQDGPVAGQDERGERLVRTTNSHIFKKIFFSETSFNDTILV